MTRPPTKTDAAIEYLKANPHLHMVGGKRLITIAPEIGVGVKIWQKARDALNLPPIPRGGVIRKDWHDRLLKTVKTAKTPNIDETVAIEVDKPLMTIRFHRRSGLQVQRSKPNRDYLNASLALFEARGWVTVSERGGVVTLKRGA